MKRPLIFLAVLFLFGCGSAPEPASIVSTAAPTAVNYPENATVFVVNQTESGARYRITETFFEGANREAQNIEPGVIETIGNAPSLEGNIVLDLSVDPPRVLGGRLEVDLLLMRTDQPRRDERLRSQWLQAYTYPTASFVLDEQDILADSYERGRQVTFPLSGQMTVRNVTIPLTFQATAVLDPAAQMITATAVAQPLISDFGIDPPALPKIVSVDDPFEIRAIVVAQLAE